MSVIINQFKGSVKRWANKNDFNSFSWQSRFYDRIIRNEKELFNIRKLHEDNPLRWEFEMNQPEFEYLVCCTYRDPLKKKCILCRFILIKEKKNQNNGIEL